MIFIQSTHTEPCFNIALEAWLFENITEDVFLLYQNQASIIVGKHQNAQSEVNVPFVLRENIPVVRRISGGGTVYQDLGNINYCIISTNESNQIDYKRHLNPLISALNCLQIDVEIGKNNELICQGLKISGTAQHVSKGKTLHHGTLLFNTNLDKLNESRNKNKERYSDKAIASNVSVVGNLSEIYPNLKEIESFKTQLIKQIFVEFNISKEMELNSTEKERINVLVGEKFSQDAWNWGNSPKYEFRNQFVYDEQKIEIHLKTIKGIISELDVKHHQKSKTDLGNLLKSTLINSSHDPMLAENLSKILPLLTKEEWSHQIF